MRLVFLALLFFVLCWPCGLMAADSAGLYSPDFTVSTRLLAGPGTLQVMVRDNRTGVNSGWINVVSDPAGDGRDVLKSPTFSVGGKAAKWARGNLYTSNGRGGWYRHRLKPKPKKGTLGQATGGGALMFIFGNELTSLPR